MDSSASSRADAAPTPSVVIRAAEPDDAHAIADQHLTTREWAYRDLVPAAHLATQRQAISRRTAMYEARIGDRQSAARTWVADLEGRIVGFAMTGASRDAGASADTAELEAIYVHPELIGKGIGRLLWQHAQEDLHARGYRRVMLWVFADNPLARNFYQAAGFTLDGGRDEQDWGGKILPAVRMSREL